MDVTELLINRSVDELRSIGSEFELPRFKEMDKKELINETELLMKSVDYQNRVEERLTIPQIRLLNIIFVEENNCKDYIELKNAFPRPGYFTSFEQTYNQVYSMGLIHATDEDQICIPKELIPWLTQFRSQRISEF